MLGRTCEVWHDNPGNLAVLLLRVGPADRKSHTFTMESLFENATISLSGNAPRKAEKRDQPPERPVASGPADGWRAYGRAHSCRAATASEASAGSFSAVPGRCRKWSASASTRSP